MDGLCPLCGISVFYCLCPAEIRQSRAYIVWHSGSSGSDLDKFCFTLREEPAMTLAGVGAHVRGGKAEGSPLVWRVSDIKTRFGGVGWAAK